MCVADASRADRWKRILSGIQDGLSLTRAAPLGGVTRESVRNWVNGDPSMMMELEQARSQGCLVHARTYRDAAAGKEVSHAAITAARHFLATHDRDAWSEHIKLQHSGSIGIIEAVQSLPALDPSLSDEGLA